MSRSGTVVNDGKAWAPMSARANSGLSHEHAVCIAANRFGHCQEVAECWNDAKRSGGCSEKNAMGAERRMRSPFCCTRWVSYWSVGGGAFTSTRAQWMTKMQEIMNVELPNSHRPTTSEPFKAMILYQRDHVSTRTAVAKGVQPGMSLQSLIVKALGTPSSSLEMSRDYNETKAVIPTGEWGEFMNPVQHMHAVYSFSEDRHPLGAATNGPKLFMLDASVFKDLQDATLPVSLYQSWFRQAYTGWGFEDGLNNGWPPWIPWAYDSFGAGRNAIPTPINSKEITNTNGARRIQESAIPANLHLVVPDSNKTGKITLKQAHDLKDKFIDLGGANLFEIRSDGYCRQVVDRNEWINDGGFGKLDSGISNASQKPELAFITTHAERLALANKLVPAGIVNGVADSPGVADRVRIATVKEFPVRTGLYSSSTEAENAGAYLGVTGVTWGVLAPIIDIAELLSGGEAYKTVNKWKWLHPLPRDLMVAYLTMLHESGVTQVMHIPSDVYGSTLSAANAGFSCQLEPDGAWKEITDDAMWDRMRGIISSLYLLPGIHQNNATHKIDNLPNMFKDIHPESGYNAAAPLSSDFSYFKFARMWGALTNSGIEKDGSYPPIGTTHKMNPNFGPADGDQWTIAQNLMALNTILPCLSSFHSSAFKNYRGLIFPVHPRDKLYAQRTTVPAVFLSSRTNVYDSSTPRVPLYPTEGTAAFYALWDEDAHEDCRATLTEGSKWTDVSDDVRKKCLRMVFVDDDADPVRMKFHGQAKHDKRYTILDPLNWTTTDCPALPAVNNLSTSLTNLGFPTVTGKSDLGQRMTGTEHQMLMSILCRDFSTSDKSVQLRGLECMESFDMTYDPNMAMCVPFGEASGSASAASLLNEKVFTMTPLRVPDGFTTEYGLTTEYVVLVNATNIRDEEWDPTEVIEAGTLLKVDPGITYVPVPVSCVETSVHRPSQHILIEVPPQELNKDVVAVVMAKICGNKTCPFMQGTNEKGDCEPLTERPCVTSAAITADRNGGRWNTSWDSVSSMCRLKPPQVSDTDPSPIFDLVSTVESNRYAILLPTTDFGRSRRVDINPTACERLVFNQAALKISNVYDRTFERLHPVDLSGSEVISAYTRVCGHKPGEQKHDIPAWAAVKFQPKAVAAADTLEAQLEASVPTPVVSTTTHPSVTPIPNQQPMIKSSDVVSLNVSAQPAKPAQSIMDCLSLETLTKGRTFDATTKTCVFETSSGVSVDMIGAFAALTGLVLMAGGSSGAE